MEETNTGSETPREPPAVSDPSAGQSVPGPDGRRPSASIARDGATLPEPVHADTAAAGAVPAEVRPDPPVDAHPGSRRRFRPHLPSVRLRLHTFDSFTYRNFRLLWGLTSSASAGWALQEVVIGWLTYDLTGSAFLTSMALGLGALPVLFVGPLGGLLVDSLDRRRLLATVSAYQALVTSAFAIMVMLDRVQAWGILSFALLSGLPWVVAEPSRMSLVARFVPKEGLMNAFALNSMAFSATRLATPAFGGLMLATMGAGPALLVQVGISTVGVFMALSLRFEETHRVAFKLGSAFTGLKEGAAYVRGEPVILGLILLGTIPPVLVMPFVHGLMPVYAAEVFDVGPGGLGVLFAALGVGSTLGTVGLASLGQVSRQGRLIVLALVWLMIGMALLTQVQSFALVLPVLALLGIGVSGFWTTATAAILVRVDEDLRGRVAGLYMVTWGLYPVGSLLAGSLAEGFSPPTATIIAAGLVAVSLMAMLLRSRVIWRA